MHADSVNGLLPTCDSYVFKLEQEIVAIMAKGRRCFNREGQRQRRDLKIPGVGGRLGVRGSRSSKHARNAPQQPRHKATRRPLSDDHVHSLAESQKSFNDDAVPMVFIRPAYMGESRFPISIARAGSTANSK